MYKQTSDARAHIVYVGRRVGTVNDFKFGPINTYTYCLGLTQSIPLCIALLVS